MNAVKASSLLSMIVVAAFVASCAPSPSQQVDPSVLDTTAHPNPIPNDMARHWAQDAQLRGLMKELSAKTQRNWPKDLPQDPEDQQTNEPRNAMGAARLADGLASSAVRIPDSVAATKMSEADRAGFQAEADILRDQALRLGQAARANKVEQMQESLDAISATCISCHSRYRDFAGRLSIQQASGN